MMPVIIPAIWQREIDAGTAFGIKAAAALAKATITNERRMRTADSRPRKVRERVGSALKNRIEHLITIKTKSASCGCANLATQMDSWGIAGCEKRRGVIVDHLVGNRDILVESLQLSHGWLGHASGLVASVLPDIVLRAGANWLLDQAIEEVRASLPEPRPAPTKREPKKHPTIITRLRSVRTPLSEAIPAARFVFQPDPAWTSEIRHLTYHIWPTKLHDGWKWNLEQLAKRWSLFNGKKILGLVTSADAHKPDEVAKFCQTLGIQFDHTVVKPNSTKLREVVTWVPMLELLKITAAGPNEVVFSAHAKGVRHDNLSKTLESWASIMYAACLDDWPAVERDLAKYLATGCFKRYNNFKTPGNDCWHYSGTFFWWRAAELAKKRWRKVDQRFYGTESWLGLHCKREETGCLFVDGVLNLYDAHYMNDVVLTEWEKRQKVTA